MGLKNYFLKVRRLIAKKNDFLNIFLGVFQFFFQPPVGFKISNFFSDLTRIYYFITKKLRASAKSLLRTSMRTSLGLRKSISVVLSRIAPALTFCYPATQNCNTGNAANTHAIILSPFPKLQPLKLETPYIFLPTFQIGSLVYKFDNEGFKKLQYIQTYGAKKSYSYQYDGDVYLAVCNTKFDSIVYLWNGKSFIKWSNFDRFEDFDSTSLETIDGQPFLFAVNPKCVYVYHLNPSDIELTSEICFEDKLDWFISMKISSDVNYKFLYITGISSYNQPVIYFVPFGTHAEYIPGSKSTYFGLIFPCVVNVTFQVRKEVLPTTTRTTCTDPSSSFKIP